MDHIGNADQKVVEARLNLIIEMQKSHETEENKPHRYVTSGELMSSGDLKSEEINRKVLNDCFDKGKKAGVEQYLEVVRPLTRWAK